MKTNFLNEVGGTLEMANFMKLNHFKEFPPLLCVVGVPVLQLSSNSVATLCMLS